jgi:hypothetical protein
MFNSLEHSCISNFYSVIIRNSVPFIHNDDQINYDAQTRILLMIQSIEQLKLTTTVFNSLRYFRALLHLLHTFNYHDV